MLLAAWRFTEGHWLATILLLSSLALIAVIVLRALYSARVEIEFRAHELAARIERIRPPEDLAADRREEVEAAVLSLDAQARYVLHQVERARKRSFGLYRNLSRTLDEIERDIGALRSDWRDPLKAYRRRSFLRACRSPIDGGVETYMLALPPGYGRKEREGERAAAAESKEKSWPLLVILHGHRWYAPFQGRIRSRERSSEAIVIAPHGKGSIDYMGPSEVETLAAIEDVCRRYRVDRDRVWLSGYSMGGTGCWHLATRYPDRFAAIAPSAGNADYHVWEELWETSGSEEETDETDETGETDETSETDETDETDEIDEAAGHFRRLRRFLHDADNPLSRAENLLHVPARVAHGSADKIVPVEHSRRMDERLKESGCIVEYEEIEGATHRTLRKRLLIPGSTWLLDRRYARISRPRHIRFRTAWLRYPGAYWLRIERLARPVPRSESDFPLEFADVEVNAFLNDWIRLEISGVEELTLLLDRSSVSLPAEALTLEVNGRKFEPFAVSTDRPLLHLTLGADGRWSAETLSAEEAERRAKERPLRKTPRLEGPIEQVFLGKFVVVAGTSSDDQFENAVTLAEAERFRSTWEARFGTRPPLFTDSPEDEKKIPPDANIVLYGGPEANRLTRERTADWPVRREGRAVVAGGRRYEGDDLGVRVVYPHPDGKMLVALFAGTTWHGTFQVSQRFGNWFHWGAYENRGWSDYAVFDGRTRSPKTFLLVGYFDQDWQLARELQWEGLSSARAAARPRRVPRLKDLPPEGEEPETLYLDELMPKEIFQTKADVGFGSSVEGSLLRPGDPTKFGDFPELTESGGAERGLGVKVSPGETTVSFPLGGRYRTFRALVGIDLEGAAPKKITPIRLKNQIVRFEVRDGAGNVLAFSPDLYPDSAPYEFVTDVSGVETLVLATVPRTGRLWHYRSAAWAEARVEQRARAPEAESERHPREPEETAEE